MVATKMTVVMRMMANGTLRGPNFGDIASSDASGPNTRPAPAVLNPTNRVTIRPAESKKSRTGAAWMMSDRQGELQREPCQHDARIDRADVGREHERHAEERDHADRRAKPRMEFIAARVGNDRQRRDPDSQRHAPGDRRRLERRRRERTRSRDGHEQVLQ